jgi:hypothetical protein
MLHAGDFSRRSGRRQSNSEAGCPYPAAKHSGPSFFGSLTAGPTGKARMASAGKA